MAFLTNRDIFIEDKYAIKTQENKQDTMMYVYEKCFLDTQFAYAMNLQLHTTCIFTQFTDGGRPTRPPPVKPFFSSIESLTHLRSGFSSPSLFFWETISWPHKQG